MTAADVARDYERANGCLDTLARLLDTTREQLPAGVGAFHRPEGLGVFLPLPVFERLVGAVGASPYAPPTVADLRADLAVVAPETDPALLDALAEHGAALIAAYELKGGRSR